jgi:hypothetical protein
MCKEMHEEKYVKLAMFKNYAHSYIQRLSESPRLLFAIEELMIELTLSWVMFIKNRINSVWCGTYHIFEGNFLFSWINLN